MNGAAQRTKRVRHGVQEQSEILPVALRLSPTSLWRKGLLSRSHVHELFHAHRQGPSLVALGVIRPLRSDIHVIVKAHSNGGCARAGDGIGTRCVSAVGSRSTILILETCFSRQ